MIATEIIRDAAGFRAIESEWRDLLKESSCNCLFLTWEWMYTWWRHLSGTRKLHLILVRRDDFLIAIAPLALCLPQIRRLMPFRVMEFLGSGSVGSDYLSFVIRRGHEDYALREIRRCLVNSKYMLELVRVEKTSAPMRDMTRQICRSGWGAVSSETTCCPYIELSGFSWDSYLRNLDESHRKYVTRKLKKLHKDFSVELKVVAKDCEREPALNWLIGKHLARWSTRGGSTAFNKRELINFHREFSEISLERGWLRLYTLKLDGVCAAALYLFRYNNVIYYYQMAFDAAYGKYSVGLTILALAIKDAIEEGAIEFDFLHGNEAYKYLWTRESRDLIRLEYYPPHVLGRIQQQLMLTKSGIRNMLDNVSSCRNTWG